ncbi:MAG: aspartyl/asparaginyl beta-hydroxylase domain-containing protein [Bdellovibrionales bacterium]|nr:aspartyl/asparaginyl beta-hydroxylase domain-containing protein [Bdellovibrionales bacterium]
MKKNLLLSEDVDISYIYQFGDQFRLNKQLDHKGLLKELEQYKDKWSHYNPRITYIRRYGLSVFNHSGNIESGPDLDSLPQYNKIHKTNYKESDFNQATPVYRNSQYLPGLLEGLSPYCVRTHFLKLLPGGFFPPHRDHIYGKQKSFRMIVPLKNYNPPGLYFIIENKILYWEDGYIYVVNTTKEHSVFNVHSNSESLWLIINVLLCKESIKYVCDHITYR